MKLINIILVFLVFTSCNNGVDYDVVDDFKAEKYMGTWYEIARFDTKYEKGLTNTAAYYSIEEKGKIRLVNSGYDKKADKWKEAEGKAKFAEEKSKGKLRISFFGPFYFDYNIISIDSNYNYALIFGREKDLMWILSRDTSIATEVKEKYLNIALENDMDTSELIWVNHDERLAKKR